MADDPSASPQPFRLFIVAGEASGDQLGAELLLELHKAGARVTAKGMGGPALERAGMERLVPAETLSVVGLLEVLSLLPKLMRAQRLIEAEIHAWRPHALLLIDFPDFNLRLAKRLRGSGIPVIQYVGPQVWAWRRGRLKAMARSLSHVMVLFPFEEEIYREAGIPVTFVGHPLVDRVRECPSSSESCPSEPSSCVALLPGSRSAEIQRLLPIMLRAVRKLREKRPDIQVLLSQASTIPRELLLRYLPSTQELEVISGDASETLSRADVAIVASGTATLEAALLGKPMVVIYKLAWPSYFVARLLVRGVRYVSWPNLLAGRRIIPEYIQYVSSDSLACDLDKMLTDPEVDRSIRGSLKEVSSRLGGGGASARAAGVVLKAMTAERDRESLE